MEDDAILKQLGTIKQVLAEYNESMINLRYDDFKSFFKEQMQQVIGEFSLDKSEITVEKMKTAKCDKKSRCTAYLKEVVGNIIIAFNNDDLNTAMKIMNDLEAEISGERSPCLDRDCRRSVIDLIMQVRALLEVSERFRFGRAKIGKTEVILANDDVPERVEKTLTPLSNCWRIRILLTLAEGRKSFTGLSQSLGLRTGHLQFHLRMLKDAGYVGNDLDHSYAITDRGVTALRSAVELVTNLG